jgi:hypothetical protein
MVLDKFLHGNVQEICDGFDFLFRDSYGTFPFAADAASFALELFDRFHIFSKKKRLSVRITAGTDIRFR